MLAIAYRFHVLPRYRAPFRHAYQAAHESMQQALGLLPHELYDPGERDEAFSLLLAWDSEASFIRFTRTWLGVWMVNGMGLERNAFAAAIETDIGLPGTRPETKRRPARKAPEAKGQPGKHRYCLPFSFAFLLSNHSIPQGAPCMSASART